MDAIELLRHDHRMVEQLLRDYSAAATDQQRRGDAVDAQALEELGQELDKAKQTAPTRPHPHAPDEPPALTMAAPVAAIYDRLRDRLQGRPQT